VIDRPSTHGEVADVHDREEKYQRFLALHQEDRPLLLANAWDVGSARLFAALGFQALASTSGGHAASLGRLDYGVRREEALSHGATLAEAVEIPVSADLEDCFPTQPGGVEETIRMALEAGLAGCSIEDWSSEEDSLYELELATERVRAAAHVAHFGPTRLVLTARAENHLRGNPDLSDTIARLQAYQEAGADVLYAPGVDRVEDLRELIASVERPVNVLVKPTTPPVEELAALGVKRISVGSAFAFAAYGAAADAAREWLGRGTYAFTDTAAVGAKLAREAFGR
jgi:2-methylisocitrate lyase-like PEP mutase family enzyme